MGGNNLAEILRQARGEGPPAAQQADPPAAGGDGTDEFRCYAALRGPRQVAFMLELRFADGNGDAFDYGMLGRARFDPSAGLVLQFGTGLVTITGKNLRPLFEAVLTHRVAWVAEADDPAAAARDPDACVVTAIEVAAAGG